MLMSAWWKVRSVYTIHSLLRHITKYNDGFYTARVVVIQLHSDETYFCSKLHNFFLLRADAFVRMRACIFKKCAQSALFGKFWIIKEGESAKETFRIYYYECDSRAGRIEYKVIIKIYNEPYMAARTRCV